MIAPPPLDQRTAADIVSRLVELLEEYTQSPDPESPLFPQWKEYDPGTGQPLGLSAALIGTFARYAEIVIQRLNKVPEKSFLAFLDLLGAARLPPEPARVPLTFALVAGRTDDAVVPAGTRVAAQPAMGDVGPVVFEVERPLVVTAAKLASLVTVDPQQDTYGDRSQRDPATAPPFQAFQGERAAERVLYVADSRLLAYENIKDLRLTVTLQAELSSVDDRDVRWEIWDGEEWDPITPLADGSQDLTRSGTVVFGHVDPQLPRDVGGRTNRWLRARLLNPVTASPLAVAGMVRGTQLPKIASLQLAADVEVKPADGLQADAGYTNTFPLDMTMEVFPFGERPKRFDTFYLASLEGFSKDPTAVDAAETAEVQLSITLAEDLSDDPNVSTDLELVWECSTTTGWKEVGRSTMPRAEPPSVPEGFDDTTRALCQSGLVTLRLPDTVARATVNGVESYWVRARIVKGRYGTEGRYVPDAQEESGYRFEPESFSPPVITRLRIGYFYTAHRPPEVCLAYNELSYQDVTASAAGVDVPFQPFVPPDQARPSLALGFTVPAPRTSFPNATLSLYASVASPRYGAQAIPVAPDTSNASGAAGATAQHVFAVTNPTQEEQEVQVKLVGYRWTAAGPQTLTLDPGSTAVLSVTVDIPAFAQPGDQDTGFIQLRMISDLSMVYGASFVTTAGSPAVDTQPKLGWQYWNGSAWADLAVRDGTQSLTLPGVVELLAPADFSRRVLFGRDQFWLRVTWREGDYSTWPRIRQLLLNTTPAVQSVTVLNEILGSSTGATGLSFRSTKYPVLSGQQLEVRETELPAAEELEALEDEEGSNAITAVPGVAGRPQDYWVRWHEVPDFYGSGPRNRHYVIDHLTGEVRFGDGVNGRIPPIGSSNIRLARYRIGGGASGNRAARTVTQLKTTVPYVDKVTNAEAAAGGAEPEPLAALHERVPRTLRHRDRAVTMEDYEDLAALASPEVARSLCVPLRDLIADPLGHTLRPGMVSLIAVPRSADAKPQPTLELLGRVRSFLEERAPAGASLAVVGPLYIRVDVRAEVAVVTLDDAGAVATAVQERLAAFLHPLTGGLDARGWNFGRAPHRSDFLALVESVAGVDHVRYLELDETEELEGVRQSGRFLVYSGVHQISVTFVGS